MTNIPRRQLHKCPVVTENKVCGGTMDHYDDHSECRRCGFFLRKGESYDKKTRRTLI